MKKIIFFIQSEGRGHLTQALAFKKLLENSDYQLIGCVLGTTKGKILPSYFTEKIGVPVWEIESPQFVKNNNKSISLVKTFTKNIKKWKTFMKSVHQIDSIIEKEKPDIIINFYEILTGLWNYKYNKGKIPVVSIGHQFLLEHSEFKFPDDNKWQQRSLKIVNKLTSYGSKEKWCLSFYDTTDENDLKIVPPLLRDEIFEKETSWEDFVLVYLCNEGYLENIKFIAQNYVHNFKVFMNVSKVHNLLPNLTVYPLSDTQFLDEMSKCKGIMMTSGFESVCEAKYLNKPCLLVPIENHYEQKCNAFDAKFADAGEYSADFNFIKLLLYIQKYESNDDNFKEWVKSSKSKIIYRLNSL